MSGAFDTFGIPPRPWIDPEDLKARYHELAALRHPDRRTGNPEAFAELNTARDILESPAMRLRLLAELAGEQATHPVPQDWDFFERIGSFVRRVAAWRARRDQATLPLQSALVAVEEKTLQQEQKALSEELAVRKSDLEVRLRQLDQVWPAAANEELLKEAQEWTFWQRAADSLHSSATLLAGG